MGSSSWEWEQQSKQHGRCVKQGESRGERGLGGEEAARAPVRSSRDTWLEQGGTAAAPQG